MPKGVAHSPSSKGAVQNILDMDDIKPSDMSFTMYDGSRTSHVPTTGNNDDVSRVKLDEIGHFALLQVVFHRVVYPDLRIWVSDCTTVVGDNVWYATGANLYFFDCAQVLVRVGLEGEWTNLCTVCSMLLRG